MRTVLPEDGVTKRIFPDAEALVEGASSYIAEQLTQAVAERGRATIALSGGNTPKRIYGRLAASPDRDRVDWPRVHVYFGDERCVPPDHPDSNYRMARLTLLDHVPLPPGNVHRIRGEEEPARAAELYSAELESAFGASSAAGPRSASFDLVLLGLGEDGHTASLFPGLPAVTERSHWVVAHYVEAVKMWRITLTPVVLNAARNVAFIVSGAAKAAVLSKVLEGPFQPELLPSQIIRPTHGNLCWLLDAAAASRLHDPGGNQP